MNRFVTELAQEIPGFKPDILFRKDTAYSFLPRMIAIVMAMVAFMLLLAISLGNTISEGSDIQQSTILVHIPAQEKQDDIAVNILTELMTAPDVKRANIVTTDELRAQMQPWFGNIKHVEELPIPTLIRIELNKEFSDAIFQSLTAEIKKIDASVITDAPAVWSENYSKFSSLVQWVLLGFSVALLAGMIGLMGYASTTAMKLHRRTVLLLHSIGATDNYIASQFQINSLLLAVKGALVGAIAASLIYAAFGAYINALDAAMLPDLSFVWPHLWVVLMLPVIAAIVGFASGRYASLHYLKRLL